MTEMFGRIRDLLTPAERRKAVLLFVMMIMMGMLEAIGVASIMPFITVLSNPDIVQHDHILGDIYRALQFANVTNFFLFLGVVTLVLVVGSLVFKAFTYWAMARFTHMRSYSLSRRLLEGYLRQPYCWFLNRHSADLGKFVLSEVNQVVSKALLPALQIVANAIVALFLIILVVSVDPIVALSAVVILGGTYAAIYLFLRGYLAWIGADRIEANRERFRVAQEALNAVKILKLHGLESRYVDRFDEPANRFAARQASSQIAAQVPRFVLQGLAFGGILASLLVLLIVRGGNIDAVLPIIALYALAGSRLLPALQEVYKATSSLRFGEPALDTLHDQFCELRTPTDGQITPSNENRQRSISLNQSMSLEKVSYRYPGETKPALDQVDLVIEAQTTVGLVGSTGAGKTTLVDVILGLLRPQHGELIVDGQVIDHSLVRGWQRDIGYVPQDIFLSDTSVAENIAFGIPREDIDMNAVARAAEIAELHGFVTQELSSGYQTLVGERGIRMSGGQRQRIGIARALYHDPDLLILDEATSALDNLTEWAVMNAVHNLGHRKTIIIIAHRLSTIRECDSIFVLDKGQVIGKGTYDELYQHNRQFQKMTMGHAG